MKPITLMALAATALTAVTLAAVPAAAHHSVYGAFDKDKMVKSKGVVKDVQWINPHTVLNVAVLNKAGGYDQWRLESQPVSFLRRAGVTKEMMMNGGKPMDIEYLPPRKDGAGNIGFLIKLTTADGRVIQFAPDK